jgi:phage host-nuclease inhibitor protein Gam
LVKPLEDAESQDALNAGGRLPDIRSLFQARAVVEPSNGKIESDTKRDAHYCDVQDQEITSTAFQKVAVITTFSVHDPVNVASVSYSPAWP